MGLFNILDIQGLVCQIVLKVEESDKWVRRAYPSSANFVKQIYNVIRIANKSHSDDFIKSIWNECALSKAVAFLWELAQDQPPTLDNVESIDVILRKKVYAISY